MMIRLPSSALILTQQSCVSMIGALLTILSSVLVVILILSEVSYFMKIDVVSRMLADSTAGVEAVKLDFDLVLYDVPCDRISFVKEVTKGTVHVNEYGNFDKFAMDDGITVGCQVRGSNLLDKVGGNFRFNIEEDKLNDRPYNISHSIVNLAFSPALGLSAREKLPDLAHSISNILTIVPDQTGVYHYAIQVGSNHLC